MTVEELIKVLEQLDPTVKVWLEDNVSLSPIDQIDELSRYHCGDKVWDTFVVIRTFDTVD